MGQGEVEDRLRKSLVVKTKKQEQQSLKFSLQFLKDGGKITVKIPTSKDIREEILAKRPSIALLTSNFLSSEKPRFNFHFNVISGIDANFIYVNDPLDDKRGGKHQYLIKDFIFGMHAATYNDLENPCLIKVQRK
jgi:hypothetical protein